MLKKISLKTKVFLNVILPSPFTQQMAPVKSGIKLGVVPSICKANTEAEKALLSLRSDGHTKISDDGG